MEIAGLWKLVEYYGLGIKKPPFPLLEGWLTV